MYREKSVGAQREGERGVNIEIVTHKQVVENSVSRPHLILIDADYRMDIDVPVLLKLLKKKGVLLILSDVCCPWCFVRERDTSENSDLVDAQGVLLLPPVKATKKFKLDYRFLTIIRHADSPWSELNVFGAFWPPPADEQEYGIQIYTQLFKEFCLRRGRVFTVLSDSVKLIQIEEAARRADVRYVMHCGLDESA